jgi:2-keto-3-deoxy-L-rhamnonate aldolase RhmA
MSLTKVTYSMIEMPSDTAANIADIAADINTAGKYAGLFVWDTTNKRMLRASGADADSDWDVVDGSTQVTPA